MMSFTRNSIALIMLAAGAAGAAWHLTRAQRATIVVYTTPALRDLLEKGVVPAFRERTGHEIAFVYLPAGQEYNRLRLSGKRPEADLLLHASPLYLEKAYASGYVDPVVIPGADSLQARFVSRAVEGGRIWAAFAWSPLVAVHRREVSHAPDLAEADEPFGFPHPVLSNNGVYGVLFFEQTSPAIGRRILHHTRVQPSNARANISGIADRSFELTLGYEAVVRFYQAQGAAVAYELPVIAGATVTTPVLFSVALIRGARHPDASRFAQFLFTNDVQRMLAKHHFRSVLAQAPELPGAQNLAQPNIRTIDYDWSKWRAIEDALPRYEVK